MRRLIIMIFLLIISLNILPQNSYEVALWYQFKDCAITYTFDDNTPKQLTVALPIFDSLGFKATFYPVINWNPDWNGFKKAAKNGHEIACHTVSHPFLNQITAENEEKEYQQSINTINTQVGEAICQTLAYPYCVTGRIDIIKKYFIGARICNGYIVPSTPSDFYNISSILVGSEGSIKTAVDLNNKINQTKTSKGWCIFLLHGIDNDGGYSAISSSELRKHLIYVKQNDENFWVTTFANAIKYIKERNCIKIEENIIGDTISVNISDTLDNNIYNVPITIRRILPENWNNARVLINNTTTKFLIETINNKKYIRFDINPDIQKVKIIKEEQTVSCLKEKDFPLEIRQFLNKIEIYGNKEYKYFIIDTTGKIVKNGIHKNISTIDLTYNSGFYILKLIDKKGYDVYYKKINVM